MGRKIFRILPPPPTCDLHQGVGAREARNPYLGLDGHIRPLAEIEADALIYALDRYDGQMSEAARRPGIGRSTLYRKTQEGTETPSSHQQEN